eukprot:492489-Hanusia_phi.AAC.1
MDLCRLPSKMRNKPSLEMEQTTCIPEGAWGPSRSSNFPETSFSGSSTALVLGAKSRDLRGEVLGEL